jgi:hypothetical protein
MSRQKDEIAPRNLHLDIRPFIEANFVGHGFRDPNT